MKLSIKYMGNYAYSISNISISYGQYNFDANNFEELRMDLMKF